MRHQWVVILVSLVVSSAIHAADAVPRSENVETVAVTPGLLDEEGTITFWITPQEQLLHDIEKHHVLRSDALDFWVDVRKGNVLFLLHINKAMNGAPPDGGEPKLYWIAALFTHLKKGHRYQAAWVWDVHDASKNGLFLNGVRQVDGTPYAYPGQIKPSEMPVEFDVISGQVEVEDFKIHADAMSEKELRGLFEKSGAKNYQDEGVRFTGEKFIPKDVRWDDPVYATTFDDPSERMDWTLEGGYAAEIENGHLVLRNAPPADESSAKPEAKDGNEGDDRPKPSHLVCWLEEEIPPDFLLEFTFRPRDPQEGLAIVFFAARGTGGQSIFDPALAERNGTFSQYINGDLNNYHVSYWAGGRGSANMRKNSGFQLVSVGKDLVAGAKTGTFQTVRIHKRGGHVRVMVDDVVSVELDDTGERYGKPWTHSGWIGLRQMARTGYAEYGHLKIWPLKSASPE